LTRKQRQKTDEVAEETITAEAVAGEEPTGAPVEEGEEEAVDELSTLRQEL
jgi:hypothetical protein